MKLPSKGLNRYEYTVKEADEILIKNYLVDYYNYSSRLLRQIKREGILKVNGKDVWFTDNVRKGDKVQIILPEEKSHINTIQGNIDVLYEDDEVIIINKEPNCVTHPTKSHQDDTLANYVAMYLYKKGEICKVRFVNRLDRDTSGIVVIAKNKYVHHFIQSNTTSKLVKKKYIAFIQGVPKQKKGTINVPIDRVTEESLLREVMENGKDSVTHYEVLEDYGDTAMLSLLLETGRTHQIRVHLNHIGCPIIGDSLYNDNVNDFGMDRQALHACHLTIETPKAGLISVDAPLLDDMVKLREYLKKKVNYAG